MFNYNEYDKYDKYDEYDDYYDDEPCKMKIKTKAKYHDDEFKKNSKKKIKDYKKYQREREKMKQDAVNGLNDDMDMDDDY